MCRLDGAAKHSTVFCVRCCEALGSICQPVLLSLVVLHIIAVQLLQLFILTYIAGSCWLNINILAVLLANAMHATLNHPNASLSTSALAGSIQSVYVLQHALHWYVTLLHSMRHSWSYHTALQMMHVNVVACILAADKGVPGLMKFWGRQQAGYCGVSTPSLHEWIVPVSCQYVCQHTLSAACQQGRCCALQCMVAELWPSMQSVNPRA